MEYTISVSLPFESKNFIIVCYLVQVLDYRIFLYMILHIA